MRSGAYKCRSFTLSSHRKKGPSALTDRPGHYRLVSALRTTRLTIVITRPPPADAPVLPRWTSAKHPLNRRIRAGRLRPSQASFEDEPRINAVSSGTDDNAEADSRPAQCSAGWSAHLGTTVGRKSSGHAEAHSRPAISNARSLGALR